MAGAIEFLRYQQLSHWRSAFSLRSQHDKLSFFLLLIFLFASYRFILLLNIAAKEFSEGKTSTWTGISVGAFLVWMIPAIECQALAVKTEEFSFLPIGKIRFAVMNILSVFFVPTCAIALVISAAAAWPLLYSSQPAVGLFGLFLYCLLAAFTWTAFFRLLKLRSFRIFLFALIVFAMILLSRSNHVLNGGELISGTPLVGLVSGETVYTNIALLAGLAVCVFLIALVSMWMRISASARIDRRTHPGFFSRLPLPVPFAETIKKDLSFAWKTPDCYLSFIVSVIYAIILVQADFSFVSYSIAITVSVMLSATLACNFFGLETAAGFERLTLFPITPTELLKSKNIGFILLVFSQSFFLLPIVLYKFGGLYLIVAVMKTISIALLWTAFCNHLSLRFPFEMSFYEFSIGGSIPSIMLATISVSIAGNLPDVVSRGNDAIAVAANTILLTVSCFVYRFALAAAAKKLPGCWENIGERIA